MTAIGVGFLISVFIALWLGMMVFWVVAMVEVAQIPDGQYRAARTEKLHWILIVVLAGIIGALIWRFAKREEVLAAAGAAMLPPPGWYPDPQDPAGNRWWDGSRWTGGSPPLPPR